MCQKICENITCINLRRLLGVFLKIKSNIWSFYSSIKILRLTSMREKYSNRKMVRKGENQNKNEGEKNNALCHFYAAVDECWSHDYIMVRCLWPKNDNAAMTNDHFTNHIFFSPICAWQTTKIKLTQQKET